MAFVCAQYRNVIELNEAKELAVEPQVTYDNVLFNAQLELPTSADGSKTEEGTEAGVHYEEMALDISIPLGTKTTVYQSEFVINEGTEEFMGVKLI